jgi:hypothetical protein
MKITTKDLRDIFQVLSEHLDGTDQSTTEVPWDFYWDISADELYDPYLEPKDLSLGQLSDDWADLLKISSGEMPAVGYALVWLSSVLRAVGQAAKL